LLKTFILSGIRADFPLLFTLAKYLPIPPLQHAVGAFRRLEIYGQQAISKYRDMEKRGGCRKTLFTNLAEGAIDDATIAREAQNLIIAGTDTTSVTLTYLVWSVLRHPSVRERLLREIKDNVHSDTFCSADAEELPYLQAVIQETLRLYGAAPGALPRVTPSGGRLLDDKFIPEGTVVATQAYSLHRDASIFADPHR
jgi:cytochrome P450